MLVHYDYYYDLLDHAPTPSYFWYRRGLGVMRHAKMKNERKHYTCAARASDDNNGTLCDYNRILYGSDGNIGSTIPLS
jgi:hypothetical protein